jgi:S-(hydroxymethyl)glutathione dehydrogenase/alcohol dehydrogenase
MPLADDAARQIVELTKGGVDHAIEAVGRPASGELAVKSLRRGGTATILGMMPLAESFGRPFGNGPACQARNCKARSWVETASRSISRDLSISICAACSISTRSSQSGSRSRQINEGFEKMKKRRQRSLRHRLRSVRRWQRLQ